MLIRFFLTKLHSVNLMLVPKNGSIKGSQSILFNDLYTFVINLIHSCIKSENSKASVSSHQILVHFVVLLTSRYEI